MTRIISGSARGRTLKVPTAGTRPTSDRVRESIFNSLQHRLGTWQNLRVLDLFAGSGAFAFESLSRGAAHATAVDKAATAIDIIKTNGATLAMNVTAVKRDADAFTKHYAGQAFDIVFIDPPYEYASESVTALLGHLMDRGVVAPGGVLVVERSARSEPFFVPDPLTEADHRSIGETSVHTLVW